MTAHSRFKIPIEINETSTYGIIAQSPLATLIRNTSLIIWDEAMMQHRYVFEAHFEIFIRMIALLERW